ncbi:MAG: hypothetical protein NTZ16_04930 [Verrucomicrobia bacterium]|nr:hypothetical protein [Verrucomicrobiota bacterium]
MTVTIKSLIKAACFGLAACIAFIVVAFLLFVASSRRPTDARLVHQFSENRAPFDELKKMLKADSQIGVITEHNISPLTNIFVIVQPEAVNISVERYAKYQALLKQTGTIKAVQTGNGQQRFYIAGWGGLNRGWRIAVTWTEEHPNNILSSLDDFPKRVPIPKDGTRWKEAYRSLGDNWYLWIIW